MTYMLWIKDGPSSPRSIRFPTSAAVADRWWAVLDGHANGGVTSYPTIDRALEDARLMVPRDYLGYAVTTFREGMDVMRYRDSAPDDALELALS